MREKMKVSTKANDLWNICINSCILVADEKEDGDESPNSNLSGADNCKAKGNTAAGKSPARCPEDAVEIKTEPMDIKEEDSQVPLHAQCVDPVSKKI